MALADIVIMDEFVVGSLAPLSNGSLLDILFDCISGNRTALVGGGVSAISYDGNNLTFTQDAPTTGGETSHVF